MKVEVLIIGQGLAGSSLALELRRRGVSFHIIDRGHANAASSVAAGLFNPIGFKRMTVTEHASELINSMNSLVGYAEQLTGSKFLVQKSALKVFSAEADTHLLSRNKQSLAPFTDGEIHEAPANIKGQFGVVEFSQTGFLKVKEYLKELRMIFLKEHCITEESFNEDFLHFSNGVRYKDIDAQRIVFCEGAAEHTSFWKDLPFRPVKGELLTVGIDGISEEHIYMKDGFLIPVGEKKFIFGSTYFWDDLTPGPTERGRIELLSKLKKITDMPVTILKHEAGVRPASHDRKPFVGWTNENRTVGILNGLGTKGVLMAPYCAQTLVSSFDERFVIPMNINVSRALKR